MLQYYLLNWLGSSLIIDIISILIIISCIGVILSNNAVISIIYLLSLYILISIYLFFIGLGIIGLLYLMIYVGAITILFLFILSLLDLSESELKRSSYIPDLLAIIFTLILLTSIFIISNSFNILSINNLGYFMLFILSIFNIFNYFNNNDLILNILNNTSDYLINYNFIYNSLFNFNNWYIFNSVTEFKIIGELLYTHYVSLFLVLGFTLILAVIGSIILLFQLNNNNNAS